MLPTRQPASVSTGHQSAKIYFSFTAYYLVKATTLHPDFFYLAAVTGDENEQAGQIFGFTPHGHTADDQSVGGSCSTLLAVVLTFGRYELDVSTTVVSVTRYAERPATRARANALTIAESEGERFTLAQIFQGAAHAQAVVEHCWLTIHLGTAPAELLPPVEQLLAD